MSVSERGHSGDSDCEDDGEEASASPHTPPRAGDDAFREFENFESGYDTDPVERYMVISGWQRRLTGIQRKLQRAAMRRKEATAGNRQPSSPPGAQLMQHIRGMREKQEAMASSLRERRCKVVGTIKERRNKLQERYNSQVSGLRNRMDRLLARARYAQARQIRHMTCFCCSMGDVVVTAYWLGASPHTHYLYYSFKMVLLIGFRAIWYRWHNWHFFMADLCYFCNVMLVLYIWLWYDNKALFSALYGLAGTMGVSTVVFRNSFVPHSLDRVTSVQIHLCPCLQLWAIRWYGGPKGRFEFSEEMTAWPSLCLYAFWVSCYVLYLFIFNRKRIEKSGCPTLYHHMAYDMGLLKALPKRLQGPAASRIVFLLGHFTLFCSGLLWMIMPFALYTFAMCFATMWTFKNGATFYITYFWKVYETQITAFEQQMRQAEAVAGVDADIAVQHQELVGDVGRQDNASGEEEIDQRNPAVPVASHTSEDSL